MIKYQVASSARAAFAKPSGHYRSPRPSLHTPFWHPKWHINYYIYIVLQLSIRFVADRGRDEASSARSVVYHHRLCGKYCNSLDCLKVYSTKVHSCQIACAQSAIKLYSLYKYPGYSLQQNYRLNLSPILHTIYSIHIYTHTITLLIIYRRRCDASD
jgi:hypothetical protein